jgi:superfamily II DNA or RNA helicase
MRLRFDRGTIVLVDPPANLDFAKAPSVLWDARVHAHRAPASSYHALRQWLIRGGTPFLDLIRPPRPKPGAWLQVDLREYQEAALSAWELARHRGILALPTGSGKTRVALAAISRTGLSALCLVPTRVLLEQWLREIRGLYRGPVGCYGDGARQLAPVTVATYESAYRHIHRLGDRFDLLIVDEVHHFGGGQRDEALEMAIARARLGLTATPPREHAAVARLGELIGPTVFELAVGDLAGGFLAGFDAITLFVDLCPEERSAYASLSAVFTGAYAEFRRLAPEASWADFARAAANTPDGRRALRMAPGAAARCVHRRQAPDAALVAGPPPPRSRVDLHRG